MAIDVEWTGLFHSRAEVPVDTKETSVRVPPWAQCPILRFGKDVYTYVGQDIGIFEAHMEDYGAVMWPAVSGIVQLPTLSFIQRKYSITCLMKRLRMEV